METIPNMTKSKEKKGSSLWHMIRSIVTVILAIALPVLLVAAINGKVQTHEKAVYEKRQAYLSTLSPEEQAVYKLEEKYSKDYVQQILSAIRSINAGKQSQAVITGPLDDDILICLKMNGFVVTNTYSTTSGYKYVSSTTHYVIEKQHR